ncbi:MAG: SEL1-like repeat protein [Rhodospirillales bacterium]|nr:SEL1-like repeat protein [Rhodospirillales bacterium]
MSRVILTTVLTIALALWSAPVSAQSAAERFKKADTEAALATLDRNYAKAEKQYRIAIKAADQAGLGGHRLVLTLNNLAEVYYIQRRYAEALPLLKRALALAKKSFGPKNTFTLTLRKKYALFQSKLGQGRPAPKRKTVTRKAAKARTGTAPAAFQEGVAAYERGDYATALRKWRPLAEKGDAAPQFNIGLMYEGGKGVAKDEAQAAVWFRKAAEQGFVVAQNNLGLMYLQGRGVAQDYAEAAKWYRKAAEQGYVHAQYDLGVMYENGNGVRKDEAQAVAWYRKAAEQGHALAQTNLGAMYTRGLGVPKDLRQAAVWFRKAADQGDAVAQENLALVTAGLRDKSRAATKDDAEARIDKAIALNSHAWFLAASDNAGERDGKKAVELAEKAARLQPDEPYIIGTLAAAYAETGRFADAISEQKKAIRLLQTAGRQDEVASFQTRLDLYRGNKPYRMPAEEAAEMRLERAIDLNNRAWKLATAPNKNERNPAEAIRLAEKAITLNGEEPFFHGTLAAAYAATGRMADAVAEQKRAIAMLKAAGRSNDVASLKARLDDYQRRLARGPKAEPVGTGPAEESLGWLTIKPNLKNNPKIVDKLQAIVAEEKASGPDHPKVAKRISDLGFALSGFRDYGGAKAAYERAIAIVEKAFGPDDPRLTYYLNNLGFVLGGMGDKAGAKAAYERSIVIVEKAFGPDDPRMTNALTNLASLLESMGDQAAVKAVLTREIAILEKKYGRDHSIIEDRLRRLVPILLALGDHAGAKAAAERRVSINEFLHGRDHRDVASSLISLAEVLQLTGDYAGAKAAYEREIAIQANLFGPDTVNVANTSFKLGSVLRVMGEDAAADAVFEKALAIEVSNGTPSRNGAADNAYRVGVDFQKLGDLSAAKAALQQALALTGKNQGVALRSEAKIAKKLAEVLRASGGAAGARAADERAARVEAAKQAKAVTKTAEGERKRTYSNEELIAAAERHGRAITAGVEAAKRGDFAESEKQVKMAVEALETGPLDHRMSLTLNTLAKVYADQKRFAEAAEVFKRSVAVAEKTMGPEHSFTARIRDQYVAIQRLADDPAAAGVAAKAFEARARLKKAGELGTSAWKLTTALDENERDGTKAMHQVKEAIGLWEETVASFDAVELPSVPPTLYVALAAAYAEAGRFTEAVAEQEKAIGMLQKAGEQDGADDFRTMLELYRQKQTIIKLLAFNQAPTYKKAESGNANAQFAIAQKYHHGGGIPKNSAIAARWYRKAANQGNSQAQAFLGLMYANGDGVEKDTAQAKRWLQKAAKQNNQLALNTLKSMGKPRSSIPKDPNKEANHLLAAAKKGDIGAQVMIGHFYEDGQGVKQDFAKALKWYRKAAAERSNDMMVRMSASMAQAGLGRMYEQGKGVTKDLREAVKWYRKAAEVGHVDGKAGLARIKRDHPEALR